MSGISDTTRTVLLKLKKRPPRNLDTIVKRIHHEVFAQVDCLDCGECCRGIPARLNRHDVERLARAMRLPVDQFATGYTAKDDDGDTVLREVPCRFLGHDNYCEVYADRPQACRDYPHTDRRRFYQLIDMSIRNAPVCPAVAEILERLARVYS